MFIKNIFRVNIDGFDTHIWKSDPEKRKRYLKYILANQLGMYKSKTQIIEMFGEAKIYIEKERWSYAITKKGVSKCSLVFYFEDEKVVKMRQEYKILK